MTFLINILKGSKADSEQDRVPLYAKTCSWLNAAEIEINVLDIECTGRRVGYMETLKHEVDAWTKRRNEQKKKIEWKFTRKNADEKMPKYYV